MYLAEDRILCFEIVTKKNEGWVLKYVKSAKASTDVPTSVPEFISQRRRWLNGSLFASIHATVFFWRIWTSGQGFFRKIFLQLEFIYNAVQLLFTWTSLANFYLAFFFLVSSATADSKTDAFNFLSNGAGKAVFEVFLKGSKWTYTLAIVLFGLCNVITLWCAGFTVYLAVPKTIEEWKDFPTGTKGDNGSAKDLGGAKKVKNDDGKEFMEVELPTAREDVDSLWAASRSALRVVPPEEKEHRDATTKQADHDRNSRTNVVLAWVGSNMAMIVVFTSTAFTDWVAQNFSKSTNSNFNPYLTFLFWAL
ncbi:glycosyltransferase family protein [Salix suchowensis]|nr:glycosyltransferase family protein [Salix suchowensis]